jgi:hypothetical protein
MNSSTSFVTMHLPSEDMPTYLPEEQADSTGNPFPEPLLKVWISSGFTGKGTPKTMTVGRNEH